MITHLEPDIMQWKVKWALGNITMNKASGGDGISVELKYDAVKVLHSICQQIWKTQQWPQDWKRSVFIPILLGASVRHSAHGKGHEEGGLTYAKAGSSLRSPPGNPRASTPITRACLLYDFVLSPTPLALRGAVPHHLFRRRS